MIWGDAAPASNEFKIDSVILALELCVGATVCGMELHNSCRIPIYPVSKTTTAAILEGLHLRSKINVCEVVICAENDERQ